MIICHFFYRMFAAKIFGAFISRKMHAELGLHRYFCIGLFLIFTGLLSTQVHADGIASVNSTRNWVVPLILEPEKNK